MDNFFSILFDTSMMPHGHCYLWNDNLVNLHVISDLLIAVSYFTIPVALTTLVRKREDLQFNYIFLFFALFIFACGATHVIAIYNVWNGAYWLSGTFKAIAAVASVVTAILVWPLIPKALALPSNASLISLNEKLIKEVQANQRLSAELEGLMLEREAQATHDPLTLLLNRRGFDERWVVDYAVAKRSGIPPLLLMVDLDHFKRVNDQYGHTVGDSVLLAVAGVMRDSLRVSDVLARFGGEEFVVVLPSTQLEEGLFVAERLRTDIERSTIQSENGDEISITCSIGLVEHPLDQPLNVGLKRADELLYQAKAAGRNRVCSQPAS